MSAPTQGYLHAETPYEEELRRLRLLEARYDAITQARLATIGSLEGLRCLEVGAGAGSVVRMLADAVGPEGHVVALDRDPRFLDDLSGAQVTVRRADILVDDIETGAYDLVHCRALLLHLSDPEKALRRMVAALRPGGWLLVEDADFHSFKSVPGHPASERFDSAWSAWMDGGHRAGLFDLEFGRRVPGLVAELGLVEQGFEALEFERVGGGPEAELFAMGFEAVREGRLHGEGLAGVDLEPLIAALRDPSFSFVDSLNVAAWGRRPLPPYFG